MTDPTIEPIDDVQTLHGSAGVISTRVCGLMLVLYALYYARTLVIPVVTAIVLYLTLRPIVRQAKKFRIPAPAAAIGIIVGILMALSLATYVVIEPAKEAIADAPSYMSVAKDKLAFVFDRLKDVDQATV